MYRVILLLMLAHICVAQSFFPKPPYTKGFFTNPVRIPVSLAGNFGECRPNHFHSGLDVRTNKVENIPIYAIADGYISRIKIEAGGFGNAIYITHANGTISLYAHLNKFWPALQEYVVAQQYKQKSWKIDLTPVPILFPVKKGQFIAFSGNTGSSQAPHLHMEIRDAKTDKPLNGLLFYNYKDTKAPLVKKLAIYDAYKSVYDQKPVQYNCVNKNGIIIPSKDTIITQTGLAGLGIVADDPMEDCLGVLGVFEVNLSVDGQPHFGWQLNNIGYEETRYMNALADYKTKKNGGSWIQLCYKLDGDKLGVYKNFNKLNGRINLNDGKAHKITLLVKDVNNNTTKMEFWMRSLLKVNTASKYPAMAMQEYKYDDNFVAFNWANNLIYDGIPLKIAKTDNANNPYSYLYQVHSSDVPIHDYFELKLKPKTVIPKNLWSKVAFVRYPFGKDTEKKGKAATYNGTWAVCNVRDLGTYELKVDEQAPSLSVNLSEGASLKGNKIICTSKDETTTVAQLIGKIDGQWVRFVQKGNSFTYEVDKYCAAGEHQLEVNAIDENGNSKMIILKFNR
jgi:hypothetical protein